MLDFFSVSRLSIVCTGLWSEPVWKSRLIWEEIKELRSEIEIKDRSIAEEGSSASVLALVSVKSAIASSSP